jgi:hypothetical protein
MEIGAPGDVITIADLEGAINYFNRLSPPRGGAITSNEVRKLADVYGTMVYERQASIAVAALTEVQQRAVAEFRARSEAPIAPSRTS